MTKLDSQGAAGLRVAIVCEHASAQFGGEAALPLHYFRVLRARGYPVWLVTHARTKSELAGLFPGEQRIRYVADSWLHRVMWKLGGLLPARLSYFTTGFISRLATQLAQRAILRKLIAEEGVAVVHQPMPVSPREPSLIHGLGVPVVIGPMNGDIDYPPAFRHYQGWAVTALVGLGRGFANALNRLMPGKLRCAVLLVANARTRLALPRGCQGRVIEMVENGVDRDVWSRQPTEPAGRAEDACTQFVFMGRLVDWKAVDLLLMAFRTASQRAPMALTVLGDGPERAKLEAVCEQLQMLAHSDPIAGKVFFAGWKSQADCAEALHRANALVLPSLMECGGAVVLEAMAAGCPVIATDWGGPADYIDATCGILVKPQSAESFTIGLTEALVTLAQSAALRQRLGRTGSERVAVQFDWEVKVIRMIAIYREAVAG